jgi:hypothetical protein
LYLLILIILYLIINFKFYYYINIYYIIFQLFKIRVQGATKIGGGSATTIEQRLETLKEKKRLIYS